MEFNTIEDKIKKIIQHYIPKESFPTFDLQINSFINDKILPDIDNNQILINKKNKTFRKPNQILNRFFL